MLADVRLAGGRTIYFPFLDDKRGVKHAIRAQSAWIVFYALLADRVLLPPSAAFEGEFAAQNLAALRSIRLLDSLIHQGAIVSSSSKTNVRDFRDLFEAYSGIDPIGNAAASSPLVYSRDERFQRKVYADYLARQLPLKLDLPKEDQEKLEGILTVRPRHGDFEAMAMEIPSIANRRDHFLSETAIAYFLAGAAGGNAITPPLVDEMPHQCFDFFYSKSALLPFVRELEGRLEVPLMSIDPAKLSQLRMNLRVFSEQYSQLSRKHRDVFENLHSSKQLTMTSYRLRAPVVVLQASVATAISTALSPVFGVMAVGVAIGSKFVWESFAKSTKLADRMVDSARKQFVRTGFLKPHEKDFLEALESFRKGINAISD